MKRIKDSLQSNKDKKHSQATRKRKLNYVDSDEEGYKKNKEYFDRDLKVVDEEGNKSLLLELFTKSGEAKVQVSGDGDGVGARGGVCV